ncbi:hypothetical protein BJ508DRAFT_79398 [Ascobolus immersus RN42]|uniref:BTB domain-containing protein n=1 Tax=Ascobolus immersus RN42 TaxID=1160509 RepID=A0A3N4HH25_ASCIM|nr:hypothetical protein BJ508DRAFT_79398 [Ascobolus immersus RN42]
MSKRAISPRPTSEASPHQQKRARATSSTSTTSSLTPLSSSREASELITTEPDDFFDFSALSTCDETSNAGSSRRQSLSLDEDSGSESDSSTRSAESPAPKPTTPDKPQRVNIYITPIVRVIVPIVQNVQDGGEQQKSVVQQEYMLHQGGLEAQSQFFRDKFSGNDTQMKPIEVTKKEEDTDGSLISSTQLSQGTLSVPIIELDTELFACSEDVWKAFTEFVYNEGKSYSVPSSSKTDARKVSEHKFHAQVWVLAHKLQARALMLEAAKNTYNWLHNPKDSRKVMTQAMEAVRIVHKYVESWKSTKSAPCAMRRVLAYFVARQITCARANMSVRITLKSCPYFMLDVIGEVNDADRWGNPPAIFREKLT